MSKTATQLALEYWNKPPKERINNTLQNYVFDYQQSIIDELNSKVIELNSKVESALDFINGDELDDYAILGNFRSELEDILK